MPEVHRPKDLPNFRTPPVSEVVLSIQFASLQQLRAPHVGVFWDTLRKEYPVVSEQLPLNATFETFGMPTEPSPGIFRMQQLLSPLMPRFWFEQVGGPDLLQLQQDRILHNWRSQNLFEYPRYESIRARFENEVDAFSRFLAKEQLGQLQPNQCEVTYVNLIELPDGLNPHEHLDDVTPLWSGETSEPTPGDVETSSIQARFLFSDGQSTTGRIYANFQPAFRNNDQAPVIHLEITARGKPRDNSIGAAFDLLDQERYAVVKTFAAITQPAMHELWGRTDGE
jgi:uncharacterized protein (TIGR04255 family)